VGSYVLQEVTFCNTRRIRCGYWDVHSDACYSWGPFKREKALPPAIQRNIEERYKLNDPLWKQYVDYMSNLIRGDLGPSYKYLGRSVNDIIRDGFPVSAHLGTGE
jgi:ABC-type dipeptide/oligopeptide/nickel transport system permease component